MFENSSQKLRTTFLLTLVQCAHNSILNSPYLCSYFIFSCYHISTIRTTYTSRKEEVNSGPRRPVDGEPAFRGMPSPNAITDNRGPFCASATSAGSRMAFARERARITRFALFIWHLKRAPARSLASDSVATYLYGLLRSNLD